MKSIASDVCTILGILVTAGGLWMIWPWLGVVALGVLLIGLGILLDLRRQPS